MKLSATTDECDGKLCITREMDFLENQFVRDLRRIILPDNPPVRFIVFFVCISSFQMLYSLILISLKFLLCLKDGITCNNRGMWQQALHHTRNGTGLLDTFRILFIKGKIAEGSGDNSGLKTNSAPSSVIAWSNLIHVASSWRLDSSV